MFANIHSAVKKVRNSYNFHESKHLKFKNMYRGSPNSTNFGPAGDRTIAKIVLSGD